MKTQPSHASEARPVHPPRPPAGFALVVTLSLMILLTVVAVGLLTLSSVSLRSASHGEAVATARANARMALMLAIGQLQKEAGPDPRITGRADIQDSDAGTGPADGINHPHWCAVWKSPSRTSDYDLDQGAKLRAAAEGKPAWLVSGSDPSTPPDPSAWNAIVEGSSRNAVVMASQIGALGAGGSASDVITPLVNLPDAKTPALPRGQFAYWVSDESIKAKLDLAPNAASEDPAKITRYLAPATLAGEQALGQAFRGDFPLTDREKLAKIITSNTLPLVMGSTFSSAPAGWPASEPDVTTYSYSVLANVRKGGLKTDLTAAFENSGTWAQTSQFKTLTQREVAGYVAGSYPNRNQGDDAGGKLWRVHSDTGGLAKANAGFRWHTLFHYYNLYKAALPAMPSPVVAGAPQPPAGLGGLGGKSLDPRWALLQVSQFPDWIQAGAILPVPLGFKAELAVSSYLLNNGVDGINGNADDEFGIRLHYIPVLVMWNPFDVELKELSVGGKPIRYILAASLFKLNAANTKVRLSNGSWTADLDVLPSAPDSNGNIVPFDTFAFQIKDGEKTFAPGEIRVFGLDADAPLPANNYIPSLTKNYVEGFSVYRNLPLANKLTRNQVLTVAFQERVIAANANYHAESVNGFPARVGSPSAAGAPNPQNRFEGFGSGAGMAGSTAFVNVLNITPPQIEGIGSLQRFFAYMSRVKGRVPQNVALCIPPHGGPGTFMNTAVLNNSVMFWDDLRRTGAGFLSSEEFQNDGNGRSFWGKFDLGVPGGLAAGGGRVQFELPRAPMLSLGQFKNLRANFPASMVTVGNSLPSPELALTSVSDPGTNLVQFEDNVQDDNWLNNDALFDGFFFSTVPPANRASSTAYPAEWGNNAGDFTQPKVDANTPLLNPRLKYHSKADGSAPRLTDLQDMDKAAANLMLEGGFNVNSTSVPAWRALLASLRLPNQPGDIPVPRFIQTLSTAPTTEDVEEGKRVLTDAQVNALAAAIVEQVKLRGPFLSVADFLNRRLENNALGRKGALQAALDASGINDAARSTLGSQPFALPNPFPDQGNWFSFNTTRQANIQSHATADSYDTSLGAPGMITQADLLQYLAPVLVARSDTFRVRAYGEALAPDGTVAARAWCEAVVQRTPEFVDQSDPALAATQSGYTSPLGNATPPSFVNSVNATFGRRFQMISFRWLSSNEI